MLRSRPTSAPSPFQPWSPVPPPLLPTLGPGRVPAWPAEHARRRDDGDGQVSRAASLHARAGRTGARSRRRGPGAAAGDPALRRAGGRAFRLPCPDANLGRDDGGCGEAHRGCGNVGRHAAGKCRHRGSRRNLRRARAVRQAGRSRPGAAGAGSAATDGHAQAGATTAAAGLQSAARGRGTQAAARGSAGQAAEPAQMLVPPAPAVGRLDALAMRAAMLPRQQQRRSLLSLGRPARHGISGRREPVSGSASPPSASGCRAAGASARAGRATTSGWRRSRAPWPPR